MGSQRKSPSKELKAKVALEAIKGDRTISQIVSDYGVHSSQVTTWKRRVLEELPEIFSRGRARKQEDEEEIKARLFQEIGELKFELDWLKKKSRFAP
jgi:putative transposase